MMSRPAVQLVRSPAAWEVMSSPVRTEIVEALRLIAPCSVAELAAVIDRPADTLYRHIELLQEAGFITEAGYRKGERNVEQLIDVAADDFAIDFRDSSGEAENRAVVRMAGSFLKATARAVRDSAEARQLEFGSSTRNLAISYELSWLTPERFAEVRGLISRLKQIMDEGKKQRQGRLYMTLAIASPVTRKRGAGNRGRTVRPARRATAARAKSRTRGARQGQ